MTKIINMKEKVEYEDINECAMCIKKGGLVVFPTETVYGIGANAFDSDAVSKIFKAKERPSDNPLIVHVSNKQMINMVAKNINEIEQKIIDIFMPGPITLILPKKEVIPENVSGKLDTIGVRIPLNDIAIKLIEKSGVPIAAPSANISGKPSGTNIEDIKDELYDKVDYMIDGGICKIGLESTVIKVINNDVYILRPGRVTSEDFINKGFSVKLDSHIFEDVKKDDIIESPGIKHKHYSPNTKSLLISAKDDKVEELIYNLIEKNNKKKIVILGSDANKYKFGTNVEYISYGNKEELEIVSNKIFSMLRKVDKYNADLCIIEGVKKEGIGIAIMNRLIRACGYNVIYE